MRKSRVEIAAVVLVAAATMTAVARSGTHERELARTRAGLFAEIQPVAVGNCQLARVGSANDGGYLVCANLLDKVQAGYSYGIAGNDDFGCSISRQLHVPVHQYDCFDLRRPSCADGNTIFHPECIGPSKTVEDGRPFDTFLGQFSRNGDLGKTLLVKSDVEGAEWNSFLSAPDDVFTHIDQLIVEFHHVEDADYIRAIQRLKQFFVIAHVHYNNFSCRPDLAPFPAWAFEALLVNKRLAQSDGTPAAPGPSALDAPNDPESPDCQQKL